VRELADLWNVDVDVIPHWAPPTHALQLFRYAEQGSIGFLWIAGTNPAVSMPELSRIRRILGGEQTFVVVNDAYRTETTELADVVLPAALWGERTGCYTNVDRTVHLSHKAVEPPGQARSDLDIWVDYARRMGFTDRDGAQLPAWSQPEEAFEAWKLATVGRPCDYSGMSYDLLTGGSGVQWPCNDANPAGTERLYTDGDFPSRTQVCETYGHDLLTGAAVSYTQHAAKRLDGRATFKTAPYTQAPETPDEAHPYRLSTGRTAYHFHTRTKTARTPQLQAAAPQMWFEMSVADASREGLTEGDLVRVHNDRGFVQAPLRVAGGRDGLVFAPFHYGESAANELTLTTWDPVRKQPAFKVASVAVELVSRGVGPSRAPTTGASAPASDGVAPTTGGPSAHASSTVGEV